MSLLTILELAKR
jgi:hypothetical protein